MGIYFSNLKSSKDLTPVVLFGGVGGCAGVSRISDGSGCICDIRHHAKTNSDWPIARLIGSATYAQLLDAAGGLFETFPDFRSDGNSASSISSLGKNSVAARVTGDRRSGSLTSAPVLNNSHIGNGFITKENTVPPPPNLVSTLLVDGELTPADMKRLLVIAVKTGEIDPRIERLIDSSTSYAFPELTLGQIFAKFAIYTLIVSFICVFIIQLSGKKVTCSLIGGCQTKQSFFSRFFF